MEIAHGFKFILTLVWLRFTKLPTATEYIFGVRFMLGGFGHRLRQDYNKIQRQIFWTFWTWLPVSIMKL